MAAQIISRMIDFDLAFEQLDMGIVILLCTLLLTDVVSLMISFGSSSEEKRFTTAFGVKTTPVLTSKVRRT